MITNLLNFREVSFTNADIVAICKMTHLKCINFIDYADVTFPQLLRICENLHQIEKLKVINSLDLTLDEVVMIVRTAHKLTSLIIENVNIDVTAFERIVDIVYPKIKSRTELTIAQRAGVCS